VVTYEREQVERLRGLESEREQLARLADPDRFSRDSRQRAAEMVERAINTTAEALSGRPGSLSKTTKEAIAVSKNVGDLQDFFAAQNEFVEQVDGKALAEVEQQISKTKKDIAVARQIIGIIKANSTRGTAIVGSRPGSAPSLFDRFVAAIGREQQRREAVAKAKAEAERRDRDAEARGGGADNRIESGKTGRGGNGDKGRGSGGNGDKDKGTGGNGDKGPKMGGLT